jgi:hypothetical protein
LRKKYFANAKETPQNPLHIPAVGIYGQCRGMPRMRPLKQTTLANSNFEQFQKPTRQEKVLAEMNAVVPWVDFVAVIEPHSPKTVGPRLGTVFSRLGAAEERPLLSVTRDPHWRNRSLRPDLL